MNKFLRTVLNKNAVRQKQQDINNKRLRGKEKQIQKEKQVQREKQTQREEIYAEKEKKTLKHIEENCEVKQRRKTNTTINQSIWAPENRTCNTNMSFKAKMPLFNLKGDTR